MFQNLRKRGQPPEIYRNFRKFLTGNYRSIWLPEFPQFSVEWFAFRKFNNFRIFIKLSQEISVPFFRSSPFRNFRNFLLNGKCPLFLKPPICHAPFFFRLSNVIQRIQLLSLVNREKSLCHTIFRCIFYRHFLISSLVNIFILSSINVAIKL